MEIPVQMFRHSSGTHDQTGGRNHAKTSAAVKSNKKNKNATKHATKSREQIWRTEHQSSWF
jgi:hypothetical protein